MMLRIVDAVPVQVRLGIDPGALAASRLNIR